MAGRPEIMRAFSTEDGRMFLDEDLKVPLTQILFVEDGEPDVYYLDKELTIRLQIEQIAHGLDADGSQAATDGDDDGDDDASGGPIPRHDAWTRDETLFLIEEMREFLEREEGMPSSIAELTARVRSGRGQQKALFTGISLKLSDTFHVEFTFKQVSRKWQSLVDGYKNAVDNNNGTGKSRSKFAYLTEMNELLGDRADIHFAVTATASAVTVHRPDTVQSTACANDSDDEEDSVSNEKYVRKRSQKGSSEASTSSSGAGCTQSGQLVRPKRKRRRADGEDSALIDYLKSSDETMATREDRLLDEMRSFRTSFGNIMDKMIDKL